MNFIINRNMPDDMKLSLKKFGNIIEASELNIKDKSVASHPDIQIHFVDGNTAYCEPTLYYYYKKVLPDYVTLIKGRSYVQFTYPGNCAYNIARVGKNIICNMSIADKKIIDYYKNNKYNIINVKQGYSKCNVCPLNDNLIVTEDMGIYHTVNESNKLRAVIMPVGKVKLAGFEYGFIGGASGLADNKLLLCGKADDELSDILNTNKIEYIELSESLLCDYGSIIPFD